MPGDRYRKRGGSEEKVSRLGGPGGQWMGTLALTGRAKPFSPGMNFQVIPLTAGWSRILSKVKKAGAWPTLRSVLLA